MCAHLTVKSYRGQHAKFLLSLIFTVIWYGVRMIYRSNYLIIRLLIHFCSSVILGVESTVTEKWLGLISMISCILHFYKRNGYVWNPMFFYLFPFPPHWAWTSITSLNLIFNPHFAFASQNLIKLPLVVLERNRGFNSQSWAFSLI